MSALSLSHLTVELGGRVVIDDASLDVEFGGVTVVVGKSGAGKSVLLKAAAGLLARKSGEVRIGAPPLVFVHQDPALLDDVDVEHNITLPARARGLPADAQPWLLKLRLADVAHLLPSRLSPSQQRRAALARALLLRPGVLIVDEPTTGLDPVAGDDVDDALGSVVDEDDAADNAAGRALVVITHHPRTLSRLMALPRSRLVVVDAGRVTGGVA